MPSARCIYCGGAATTAFKLSPVCDGCSQKIDDSRKRTHIASTSPSKDDDQGLWDASQPLFHSLLQKRDEFRLVPSVDVRNIQGEKALAQAYIGESPDEFPAMRLFHDHDGVSPSELLGRHWLAVVEACGACLALVPEDVLCGGAAAQVLAADEENLPLAIGGCI